MKKDKDKNKKKSFMDTVREIDEQERIEKENLRKKYKEQEEKKRLEYEDELRKQKIELLKDKQGVKDFVSTEEVVTSNNSFFKKISNFFFFHKWWLIPAIFAVALASFLTFQLLTREKSDLIILLITDDSELQSNPEKIENYFANFTEDYNKNGKIEVSVYTVPINDEEISQDYYRGNATYLNTQLQMGEAVLIISDDYGNEYIDYENTIYDLEEQFPDNENIKNRALYLSGTDFAEKIGYEGELDDDICLEIREVKDEYSFKKKMQKTFNNAYPVLEKVINDLED